MQRHIVNFFAAFAALIVSYSIFSIGFAPQAQAQIQTPTDKAKLETLLAAPVFEAAIDYTSLPLLQRCREERVRVLRYHACRSSDVVYEAALKTAKAKGQPLVVFFGFNTCPYCRVMEAEIFNPAKPLQNADLVPYFSKQALKSYIEKGEPLTLSYVNIHARAPHGLALADRLGITEMAKARGWHRVWSPFVVFVDPESGKMVSQSRWEAPNPHCLWVMDAAANLEEMGKITAGEPLRERTRCPRK